MASAIMNDIAQWVIRFAWCARVRRRSVRRRRPDFGRLSAHLRRDVGLDPDTGP